MPANYVLIQEITTNTNTASVTFSNIPQTGYTDLKLVMSVRDTYNVTVSAAIFVNFNGSSASLSSRYLQGAGSGTPVSAALGSIALAGLNTTALATANTFSNIEMYIPNYRSSSFKSFTVDSVTENNATEAYANMISGLWSNTAAITSMTFTCGVAFVPNSTFSLYGIAALGTTPTVLPKASGGDIVTNDGTYWYHAFLSSGIFTPNQALNCDYLVVAGGGGGGNDNRFCGGGGAGGLRALTAQPLTAINYAVTVGAGGPVTTNGSNSVFSATTSTGGGASSSGTGANGGSGGGGGLGSVGGSASPAGQGNNGGTGNSSTPAGQRTGGGGGGATAVGGANTQFYGGAGGAGSSAYSSWGLATNTGQNVSGTVSYAGGGGGSAYENGDGVIDAGVGGVGGGGKGGRYAASVGSTFNAIAGSPNTGGGGGGAAWPGSGANGAAGGSGIVIVRYTMA
jgi:hypothetical protein